MPANSSPLRTTLRLLPALLLLLGSGCDSPPPDPLVRSTQIVAYAAALEAGQAEGCVALDDLALRGDCLTATAIAQASKHRIRDARATCDHFPADADESRMWRDECFFQIVDAAALRGADAMAACQELSTFSRECLSHVAARAVEEDILRHAQPGNERLIHQQIFSTLRRYMDSSMAEVMAQDMVTRWVTQRLPEGGPFDPQVCGQLGMDMCARVYEHMVRGPEGVRDTSAPWRQACQQPLSVALARSYDLPAWVPGSEPIVQQAWSLLCSL